MNTSNNLGRFKKFCFGALLVCSISAGQAQTFTYNVGDLVVGLRQTAGGTSDVLINLGPVNTISNLAAGTKIVVANLSGSVLASAFGDTNNLSWSAFACYDATVTPNFTLFMTRPRTVYGTQSTPWSVRPSQSSPVGVVGSVGTYGQIEGGVLPGGANNKTGLLVEPESFAHSYYKQIFYAAAPSAFNWNGTFQGDAEQSTSGSFTTSGQPVRADFYSLVPSVPGPGSATYLGYFEMNTNGVLTYTAGPSPSTLVQPRIVNITRNSTTTTVYFTTGSSGSYSLLAANSLAGTAVAGWPQVGSSVPGNGLTNSITDTYSGSQRFYAVKAQ